MFVGGLAIDGYLESLYSEQFPPCSLCNAETDEVYLRKFAHYTLRFCRSFFIIEQEVADEK